MTHIHDLTPYQYDFICNGCGSKKGWIRPPKAKFFKDACDKHDLQYYEGYTEEHRKKSDKKLKDRCFLIVNNRYGNTGIYNWINRRRYYTWCRLYYHGVRLGGKKSFYYGSAPQPLPEP